MQSFLVTEMEVAQASPCVMFDNEIRLEISTQDTTLSTDCSVHE